MPDSNITEIVRIFGIDIETETIPAQLKRRYDTARATLDYATKTGNGVDDAKAKLKEVATEVIVEMAPLLAIKAAQKKARRMGGPHHGLGYL